MKKNAQRQQGRESLEIIEEALHLLRIVPVRVFTSYYAGSLPFVLGFLYFWTDMSQGAFSYSRSAEAAFSISLLFLWMKTWQAIYTSQLRTYTGNIKSAPWTPQRILNVFVIQTVIQSTALLALPLALLIALPFGWVYAFYQNVTVCGSGENCDIKSAYKKSLDHAMLFPVQNHMVLTILFLFSFFVFLNLAIVILMVPNLLNTFLGIQLMSSRASWSMVNTTFLAVTCGFTYLIMDPLVKSIYIIRCFYGESLHNGEDLIVELNNYQRAGKLIVFLVASLISISVLLSPAPAFADKPTLSAIEQTEGTFIHIQDMDKSIEDVISQRKYSWRIPRQKPDEKEKDGLFGTFINSIVDFIKYGLKTLGTWIKDAMQWIIENLFSTDYKRETHKNWLKSVNLLIYVLLGLATCMLAFLIWKAWIKKRPRPEEEIKQALPVLHDITDEDIKADELPAEGWLKMAAELMEKGDHRHALRALYLASLSYLAQQEMISIAKYKSNRDYVLELQRKTQSDSDVLKAFIHNMGIFESIWYGMHDVTKEVIEGFRKNHERVMAFNE